MKARKITLYVLAALVSIMMLMSGFMKVTGNEMMVENMAKAHFSEAFVRILGLLELLGVAGLWLPRTRALAAIGLILILVGAIATHIVSGQGVASAAAPVLFTLALGAIIWLDGTFHFDLSHSIHNRKMV